MSTEASADRQQLRFKEFMSLLPLTVAIAGLPESKQGEYFSEGQMENRAVCIRNAYKVARALVQDIVK